jgi:ATP/ADP translocase
LRSSVHRSIWEQAFIPVDSRDRSTVKLMVDGVASRIAETIGAVAILIWLKQAVPGGTIDMPLDTRWMSWVILATVAAWLIITRTLRVQAAEKQDDRRPSPTQDVECERFPDQCPCTTELGKGVA